MTGYTVATPETTAADWQASLDYANDQARWPRDPRHACGNPECGHLTEALFCSEACRVVVEGIEFDEDDYYQDGEGCLLGNREIADAQRAADGESLAALVCGYSAPTPPAAPAPAPLPNFPISATVKMVIAGHTDVLITMRGTEDAAVLARLDALLKHYPAPAPTSPQTDAHVCPLHGVTMQLQHGKEGSTWYSHKSPNGQWCKGKQRAQ